MNNNLSLSLITKIISGGQTGADRGGLIAGYKLGIPIGGHAPKGWLTEAGVNPKLANAGLIEDTDVHSNKRADIYRSRTKKNVINSDGTVLFGHSNTAGSRLTIKLAQEHNKPCLCLFKLDDDDKDKFKKWIVDNDIQVLNVAGNRESKNPYNGIKIEAIVRQFLIDCIF